MKIGEAFVEIRPDTKGFGPQVQKETASAADKAKASFKGLLAGAAVGLFAKGAFSELEEAQKSAKQLEQTIKSTGGAAGVTAQHASDLADQISRASTVDDELVANTERILLTFKEIKNTDIDKTFDRATQAAIDLAAGLGGDAQAAALQLGKALNDPVKGITALARAGVSFTQAQKDTIKSLVATGQAAKAQGIILGEVEAQFGGQAAAAATDADKARVAFANFQESVGTALAPAIADAAKGVQLLSEGFSAQPPILQQVELAAGAVAVAYSKFGEPIKGAAASLRQFNLEATGLKGALGKAGLAGAITVGAIAAEEFFNNWQTSRLRDVTGDVDDLTTSLNELGESGTGFDVKGLADDFKTLDDGLVGLAANPVFRGSFFGENARAGLKAAKEDIDAVDKALAALVESGSANQARKDFEAITAGLKAQGFSVEDIAKRFDDYTTAVDKNGRVVVVAADGTAGFADEAEEATRHIKTAAEAVDEFNDSIDEYLDKALSAEEITDNIAQGFIDLAESVKAVKDQPGKQGLIDFQANTPAALAYRDTIRSLVETHADLIKNAGGSKAEVDLISESFRRQAEAAGVPREEIEKYVEILTNIPPDVETQVRVEGILKARTDTAELAKRLGDVDGKTVHARVDIDHAEAMRKLKELRDALIATKDLRFSIGGFAARAGGGPLDEGWTLVGEQGPELANKRGSQVDILSNQRTRSALRGGGTSGGGTTIVVQVQGFVVGTERGLASNIARLLEGLDAA